MFKRILAKIVLALSTQPAFRGAASNGSSSDPMKVLRHDEIDEAEIETACFAGNFAKSEDYVGTRVAFQEQLAIMQNAKNRRYLNSCLGGAQETERFIAERTRE
jgi:hypothetical protein